MKPGTTVAGAQSELDVAARQLEIQYPDTNKNRGARVISLRDDLTGPIRPALLILQAAVLLILLIASANVANLLLARAATQRREIAIRTALGAGRGRLIRQMLTESIVLSSAGGAVGLLPVLWSIGLESPGASVIPELNRVAIDWRVGIFAVAVSLLTGIVFGLVPALGISLAGPGGVLKAGGRAISNVDIPARNLLIVGEIAVALTVLVCAGLLVNSFIHLRNIHPGFDATNVLTGDLSFPESRYPDGNTRKRALDKILEQVQQVPGVASASAVSVLPESANFNRMVLEIEGRPKPLQERPRPDQYEVTPDYFRTFAIPLRQGRFFTSEDDREHTQVAVINETAALRLWPGENPVGRRVKTGGPDEPWRVVTGVVGDVYQYGLDSRKTLQVYVPYAQNRVLSVTLLVRAIHAPAALTTSVRAAIATVDRAMPLSKVNTMKQVLGKSMAGRRFPAILLSIFGGCALLLGAMGTYAVLSYSVAQRIAEFGIRIALGAQRRQVMTLVLSRGLMLTGAGLVLGLGGALALSRFLSRLLFGVTATDPFTYLLVASLLFSAALLACVVPAWRAMHADPMVALRSE